MSDAITIDEFFPRKPVRQSILDISPEMFAAFLGLPAGSRIVEITGKGPFAVKIEDERLRIVSPGCRIPTIHTAFFAGSVSLRQKWDGYLKPVPPTIRPDADKIAALLQRVSAELGRCNADTAVHCEVVVAILELKGEERSAEISFEDSVRQACDNIVDHTKPILGRDESGNKIPPSDEGDKAIPEYYVCESGLHGQTSGCVSVIRVPAAFERKCPACGSSCLRKLRKNDAVAWAPWALLDEMRPRIVGMLSTEKSFSELGTPCANGNPYSDLPLSATSGEIAESEGSDVTLNQSYILEPGTRVRMTEKFKQEMMAADVADPIRENSGTVHVAEFGDCEGIVLGLTDYEAAQGPEMDVRWQPSGLRYAYLPDDLEVVEKRPASEEEAVGEIREVRKPSLPLFCVFLFGREISIVHERSECSPWQAECLPDEPQNGFARWRNGIAYREGNFAVDLPRWPKAMNSLKPGIRLRIDHLNDNETFVAIITRSAGDVVHFRSDGAPVSLTTEGDSDVAALAEAVEFSAEQVEEFVRDGGYCPQGHHKKDGPCKYDYCACECPRCRQQREEGGR